MRLHAEGRGADRSGQGWHRAGFKRWHPGNPWLDPNGLQLLYASPKTLGSSSPLCRSAAAAPGCQSLAHTRSCLAGREHLLLPCLPRLPLPRLYDRRKGNKNSRFHI